MSPTSEELEAYLDEALSVSRMSAIEETLRTDAALRERLADILRRRDSGAHVDRNLARARASCPGRAEWGRYLLGVLDDDHAAYLAAHLDEIGCRACAANVADSARVRRATPRRRSPRATASTSRRARGISRAAIVSRTPAGLRFEKPKRSSLARTDASLGSSNRRSSWRIGANPSDFPDFPASRRPRVR
ncbi:MAG: hypothetical protein QM811_21955 [Pirellulales bacterium]